ncbi:FHA domain-containing protein [Cellulomonas sp. CW35]|uniref:FHA domain-containing protein n=1 Tax=Cellulomonas sp. CW35 TaxID=3458249 RepID=UPI00403387CC
MSVPEYLPGRWTAVSRPGFVALLGPTAAPATARAVWEASPDGLLAALVVLARNGFAGLPAFALVHLDGDRAHLALRGDVTVEVGTASGPRTLRSGDVGTWSEQVVEDVTWVRLLGDDASDEGTPLPLADGVASGSVLSVVLVEGADEAGDDEASDDEARDGATGAVAGAGDEPTPDPAAQPGSEPAVEPVVEPAAERVVEPAPEPAAHPDDVVIEAPPAPLAPTSPVLPPPGAPILGAPLDEPVEVPAQRTEPDVPVAAETAATGTDALEQEAADETADENAADETAADEGDDEAAPDEEAAHEGPRGGAGADESGSAAGRDAAPRADAQPGDAPTDATPTHVSPVVPDVPAVPDLPVLPAPPAPEPVPALVALGTPEADVESTVDDVRTLVGPASQDDHDGLTILSSDLAQIREQLPAWAAQWPQEGATPGPFTVPEPVVQPDPPRLVLSTGVEVTLDRTVLLGRAPQVARVTNRELPRLVAVPSPQQDISRTHAEVRAEGEHVLVTDLHSTNGVHVTRQGEGARRLHPGEASVVVPGEVVDLGDGVTFTVEAGR